MAETKRNRGLRGFPRIKTTTKTRRHEERGFFSQLWKSGYGGVAWRAMGRINSVDILFLMGYFGGEVDSVLLWTVEEVWILWKHLNLKSVVSF